MQLTCPDCHVECTIDEQSAVTVTCPGCGILLYSKSGRSGPLVEVAAARERAEVSEVELEKTRQWQRSVDERLPEPNLFPQQIGRYELKEKLGEGSFAEVFLAFDMELNREVALKIPRRNRFTSADQLRLFLDEARTAAILEHPGIVRVYDIGWLSDEVCFISMEHCSGGSLNDRIKTQSLSAAEAAEMVETLAEAMNFAHLHGFVHRDLKPNNVMFGRDGRPRVVDFGLAISDEQQLKHAGEIAGTIPYMSPEQIRGEAHHLDGRSDIWSLGIILYQLLVGRRPFSGSRELISEQIRHREAKPLRQIKDDVPAELERICLRCLQKSPADRYATAKDFAQDLRAFRGRQVSPAAPETPQLVVRPSHNRQSHRRIVGLSFLVLFGCISALSALLLPLNRPVETTELHWNLDKQPLGMAFDLLKRTPRKLAWPTQDVSMTHFTHDPKNGLLTINSPSLTLLELGETEAIEFQLEADIYLTAASGAIGLFWGFGWEQENGVDKFAQLQSAVFRCYRDDAHPYRFELEHMRVWPHHRHGLALRGSDLEGMQLVSEFPDTQVHRLFVHLGAERLIDLAWDRHSMPGIGKKIEQDQKAGFRPPFRVKGRFGILTQGASATLRNVRFTPIMKG